MNCIFQQITTFTFKTLVLKKKNLYHSFFFQIKALPVKPTLSKELLYLFLFISINFSFKSIDSYNLLIYKMAMASSRVRFANGSYTLMTLPAVFFK